MGDLLSKIKDKTYFFFRVLMSVDLEEMRVILEHLKRLFSPREDDLSSAHIRFKKIYDYKTFLT